LPVKLKIMIQTEMTTIKITMIKTETEIEITEIEITEIETEIETETETEIEIEIGTGTEIKIKGREANEAKVQVGREVEIAILEAGPNSVSTATMIRKTMIIKMMTNNNIRTIKMRQLTLDPLTKSQPPLQLQPQVVQVQA